MATSSPSNDVYLLSRGGMAQWRLNFQHFALNRRLGWLLHPDIKAAIDKKKDVRIAELAAGTGVWAFDLAQEYPDAKIIGLDMSAKQYPAKSTWPANVQLEQHNLFDPVPAKYENYFDLVHVRLLVAGIYNLDRDLLMTNIIGMMKPGGVIQWEDMTSMTVLTVRDGRVVTREPPLAVQSMTKVVDFNAAVRWANQLPRIFEKFGLVDAAGYEPPIVPSALPIETEALIWAIKELIELQVAVGKPGAQEELASAIASSEADFARGDLWAYSYKLAMATKPLS